MPEKLDELALIAAAGSGDVDSFTELCRRYYPAMVAIGYRMLGDRHLAEDAAQETFARAVRSLPKLKNGKLFACWLATICRNITRDMVRSRQPYVTNEDLSWVATGNQPANELLEEVHKTIRQLPEDAQELIYLRYYNGIDYEQIGAVLGISRQAVNGRLRRVKKTIAKILERNGSVKVKL